jgi:hypothetical protein
VNPDLMLGKTISHHRMLEKPGGRHKARQGSA